MALEPWSDFVPVQPPEAVQDVVFVETHVRVVDCPWVRVVVLAEKESVGVVEGGGVGGGGSVTVIVISLAMVSPSVPVQRRV